MKALVAALVVTAGILAIMATGALLVGSLSSSDEGDDIDREPLTIVTSNGSTARLQVEVADTPEERTAGLSNRTELTPDTGMLFIIPERGPGFWMRDTLLPLSVAFIDQCGAIIDIQDMQPQTTEMHQADGDYKFGLEVAQGWFGTNGIVVGDIVSIPRDHRYEGC